MITFTVPKELRAVIRSNQKVGYSAKFMALLKEAGLADQIDKVVWDKEWNINSKAVGDGQSSLKYLAPYVHRVALADSRVTSFDKKQVTFSYKKSHSRRPRYLSLEPMEFLHRFLQHTLPSGFMKIRYYGFMNPNCRYKIQQVREKISLLEEVIKYMIDETPGDKIRKSMKLFTCDECGGLMELTEYNFRPCEASVLGAPPDRKIAC